jgi:hypothetical protein
MLLGSTAQCRLLSVLTYHVTCMPVGGTESGMAGGGPTVGLDEDLSHGGRSQACGGHYGAVWTEASGEVGFPGLRVFSGHLCPLPHSASPCFL